ncbi:MAG: ImmA/IrrE family metallo-endopeptidase [Sphingobacteriales bacterium]
MGLALSPEARMARKILEKHKLTVPFDLDKLVNEYAKIRYKSIPIEGVDGVCLNVKRIGKTPTVIVNDDAVISRQRFTLAHELGHIIIPWHLGTIIDDIDADNKNLQAVDQQYWELEREANRFASELLMPIDFILKQFKINPNPDFLIEKIKLNCGVSDIAARIRMGNAITEITEMLMPEEQIKDMFVKFNDLPKIQDLLMENTPFSSLHVARHMARYLPGKLAFCVEEDELVKGCGGTSTTHIYYQFDGDKFQSSPYPHFSSYRIHNNAGTKTHWWSLDVTFSIEEDIRDWRKILDKIAFDINPIEGIDKFKRSMNGKLSGLNSQRKGKNRYVEFDQFLQEAIHRFNSKDYEKVVAHPDFFAFIKKRSESLFGV